MKFNGDTFVVTGASSGLGLAMARLLVANGAKLITLSRGPVSASALGASAGDHEHFTIDLSDEKALDALENNLSGRRDIVGWINNAGFALSGNFDEMDWADIAALNRLNIGATARLSHFAIKLMKENGGGHLLNISAMAALQPQPFFAAFAASRAYITALSLALSAEARPYGISVSCAHPGSIRSGFETKAQIGQTRAVRMLGHMSADKVAKKALTGMMRGKIFFIIGLPYKFIHFFGYFTPRRLMIAQMAFLFRPTKHR